KLSDLLPRLCEALAKASATHARASQSPFSKTEKVLVVTTSFPPRMTRQTTVEKTVDLLDSEVKSLLNTISETAWNVPLAPGTPLMDIFEGTSHREM
uniref:Uncharacterized protein n=1 Tax=Podarcis muralis TaxID=64176 RepID=A0A670HWG3_PODMU